MPEYSKTPNSTVFRNPQAATYNRSVIHALIDATPYCHISAQVRNRPYIQATVHWREDDRLYVHGAPKNKMMRAITRGAEAALAFTHFDGYVLPRSAFNHAVSYRSVMLFSKATPVSDLSEKRRLLELFVERISPGRWRTVRQPTETELKMTSVLEFKIEEVSAKLLLQLEQLPDLMPGGKYELEADRSYSPWTGIVPFELVRKAPLDATDIHQAIRALGSRQDSQDSVHERGTT